jgi:uncharacterized protein YllA (UPF0747 family)
VNSNPFQQILDHEIAFDTQQRLKKLELAQESNVKNFQKINQLLKDMGAAINRIIRREAG